MDKIERQRRENEWIRRQEEEDKLEEKFNDLVQDWLEQSSYESWWLDTAIHNFIAYLCLDRGYKINERKNNKRL